MPMHCATNECTWVALQSTSRQLGSLSVPVGVQQAREQFSARHYMAQHVLREVATFLSMHLAQRAFWKSRAGDGAECSWRSTKEESSCSLLHNLFRQWQYVVTTVLIEC